MARMKIVVLGGGVVGAATADALARRGQEVVLLEQYVRGHGSGSSHGDGRIFRFVYPEAIYVEMARLAKGGWQELEARTGQHLLALTGNWDCAPAGSGVLEALQRALDGAGLHYERLSAELSNASFPQFHLPGGWEALYQDDGGALFSARAMTAFWKSAEDAGAQMRSETRVVNVLPRPDGIAVTCASGETVLADRLVLAAGAWSAGLGIQLGLTLPLAITREQLCYFAVRDEVDHRPGAMPTFVSHEGPRQYFGLPVMEGAGVKVGWNYSGTPIAKPEQATGIDTAIVRAICEFTEARLPHLDPDPLNVATCLYAATPDNDFILDRSQGDPRIVVGAAFSGHGFKFAPVLGSVLAALALDEEPPVSLDRFRIDRF